MSLTRYPLNEMASEKHSGSATASSVKLPKLRAAQYNAWRPQATTALSGAGIPSRVYTVPIPHWSDLVRKLDEQEQQETDAAIAAFVGAAASSKGATKSASTSDKQTEDERRQLRLVADTVERSRKAYGLLYAALERTERALWDTTAPEAGNAYKLWTWLETKFRNTEAASVNDLLTQFFALHMEASENFETYKARVDSLDQLLDNAKEKVSRAIYAHRLMYQLRPEYRELVLSLSRNELLNADKTDWDAVARSVATYERTLMNTESSASPEGEPGWANAVQRRRRSPHEDKRRSQLSCSHCGIKGHSKDDCYRLHPEKRPGGQKQKQGSRFNREQRASTPATSDNDNDSDDADEGKPQGRANAMIASKAPAWRGRKYTFAVLRLCCPSVQGSSPTAPSKSKSATPTAKPAPAKKDAQDRQKRTAKEPESSSSNSSDSDREPEQSKSTPKRGLALRKPDKPVAKAPEQKIRGDKPLELAIKEDTIGIDSMASVHTAANKQLLFNLRRCTPMTIQVADGATVVCHWKGDLELRVRTNGRDRPLIKVIEGVYYNERFTCNLISVGRLEDMGWELHLSQTSRYLKTKKGAIIPLRKRGHVYVLELAATKKVFAAQTRATVYTCRAAKDLVQLHNRLGHASWTRLLDMCHKSKSDGIGTIAAMSKEELATAEQQIKNCTACCTGKSTKKALGHRGLDKGTAPFEVLHMDTGYATVLNPATGKKETGYFLLATDPYTGGVWAYDTTNKKLLVDMALRVIKSIRTQTGKRIKRLHSDLGSEFENNKLKAYCKDRGIEYHPAPTGEKEMNGLAEGSVRLAKEAITTMINHARKNSRNRMEQMLWPHALRHYVFVKNRSHISKKTGKTQYELQYGKKPSVENVGVFGCDAFVHRDRKNRATTFSPRAEPGVYLGHDFERNCPTILLLGSNKIIRCRSVEFREGTFNHLRAVSKGDTYVETVLDTKYHSLPETEAEPDSDEDDQPERQALNDSASADTVQVSSDEDQSPPTPPDEYHVKRITAHKGVGTNRKYQIEWVGYKERTWEPLKNLSNCRDKIAEYLENQETERQERRSGSRTRSSTPPPEEAKSNDDGDEEMQVLAASVAAKRLRQVIRPPRTLRPLSPDSESDEESSLDH